MGHIAASKSKLHLMLIELISKDSNKVILIAASYFRNITIIRGGWFPKGYLGKDGPKRC